MLLMLLTGQPLAPEDFLDRGRLVSVVLARAGAVGVDVMNVGGGKFGIGQRFLHRDDRAHAVGVLIGDAICVGG